MPVTNATSLKLLIASDMEQYNGTKKYTETTVKVKENLAALDLEPYSARYYLAKQPAKTNL